MTYLTTSPSDARDFAKQMARQRGGNPVVYMVRADKQPRLNVVAGTGKRGTLTWFTTGKPLSNPKAYRVKK